MDASNIGSGQSCKARHLFRPGDRGKQVRRESASTALLGHSRLLREIVAAARSEMPVQMPLFVRISVSDWTPGGWAIEDSVALAKMLREAAVDLIDCSSGGNVPHAKIPNEPGYQVSFAARIRREADIPAAETIRACPSFLQYEDNGLDPHLARDRCDARTRSRQQPTEPQLRARWSPAVMRRLAPGTPSPSPPAVARRRLSPVGNAPSESTRGSTHRGERLMRRAFLLISADDRYCSRRDWFVRLPTQARRSGSAAALGPRAARTCRS